MSHRNWATNHPYLPSTHIFAKLSEYEAIKQHHYSHHHENPTNQPTPEYSCLVMYCRQQNDSNLLKDEIDALLFRDEAAIRRYFQSLQAHGVATDDMAFC